MKVKFTCRALESLGSKDSEDSPKIKKAKAILKKLSKFKVSNNCQKFAAAIELAYRGQDVEVTETSRPDAKVFDVPVGSKSPYANWCLIRNGEFKKIAKSNPLESIESTMLKWGEGARAIIAVTWTGGHSGHVFNLQVIDGEVYLLDGTHRSLKKIRSSKYVRENIDAERSTGILRSDRGSIDSQMKNDTFTEDIKEFGLSPDEEKYLSVTHLLSKEGEKGKRYDIYRTGVKIGTVRCDSIDHKYGEYATVWNYSWV